jgi:hypothetical protein
MKEVFKMKKILFSITSMVFVLTLGTAYAADMAGKGLGNGITDFTGRSYESFDIGPAHAMDSVEGVSAGGLRVADKELNNGITDFSGRSYEAFDIGPAHDMNSVEGVSAGGLRAADKGLYNAVTDFTGGSYD